MLSATTLHPSRQSVFGGHPRLTRPPDGASLMVQPRFCGWQRFHRHGTIEPAPQSILRPSSVTENAKGLGGGGTVPTRCGRARRTWFRSEDKCPPAVPTCPPARSCIGVLPSINLATLCLCYGRAVAFNAGHVKLAHSSSGINRHRACCRLSCRHLRLAKFEAVSLL